MAVAAIESTGLIYVNPHMKFWSLLARTCCLSLALTLEAGEPFTQVGVAKIDITPDYPIRLCGYAVRKKESEGVAQHLWAKALAIGSDKEEPAILITVDNTGVPASIRNEVAQRLLKKGIKSERIALCSSTAPHPKELATSSASRVGCSPSPRRVTVKRTSSCLRPIT